MKRMSKIEVHLMAEKKAQATMMHVGIFNARKVLYAAWKWAQQEEKRQKETSNGKKLCKLRRRKTGK